MTVHAAAPGPLVARTVEIDDPRDLIASMPEPGISWVRRGEGMVAWGEVARLDSRGADRIDAAQAWWRLLCRHATVRDDVRLRGTGLMAFGSFSFADASPSGGALVVPRFVLGRRDGRAWFTTITAEGDAEVSLDEALANPTTPEPPGDVTSDEGDRGAWREAVEAAVARIQRGELEKVVLARAIEARSERPIDVRFLLTRLADEYPMCWAFHVDGMVGASPELLARVDHGLVTSRVLAGTIRMTGDDMGDLARAGALARSSKDREEHEYAARSVTQALAAHCASVNVPEEPFVLHLPNVMHLATDITGVLSHNASALELVRELHPSAAVCGTPTLAAARIIDQLEGLDRGRYAGPVGWIDAAGDGEWCIGLRSAELSRGTPNRLRLFAGCGIVAASEADSEWAESEAKLEPMRRALGIVPADPGIEVAQVPVETPAATPAVAESAEPEPEPESEPEPEPEHEPEPIAEAAVEGALGEPPSASAEKAPRKPARRKAPAKPRKAAVPKAAADDSARETPTEQAPAEEAPAEEAPAEEAPSVTEPAPEEAPAEEAPAAPDTAAQTPAEETPAVGITLPDSREPRVEFDPPPAIIEGGATFEEGGDAAFPTLRVTDADLSSIPTIASGSLARPTSREIPTRSSWDTAEWEERYRAKDAVWSSEPNPQLVDEVATLPTGRALDAGCGEGADAVHLAKAGWVVTAVDISETAISRGRQLAVREAVAGLIDWRVADATSAGLGLGEFDLVTAHYAHPEAGIASLVRLLARHVAPEGVLLVVGHDPRDPHVESHPRLSRTAFRAEDAALGLDPEVWDVEVAEVRERTVDSAAEDEPTVRLDSVLRARRTG